MKNISLLFLRLAQMLNESYIQWEERIGATSHDLCLSNFISTFCSMFHVPGEKIGI